MTPEPRATWIRGGGSPVAAHVHLPEEASFRGGVVLCPPIGFEHLAAHASLWQLADDLARSGFAAVRIDYPGTGDSSDPTGEPDLVPAWVDAVRAATDHVRAMGVGPVAIVGMRIGATLVAAAADRLDVAATVLWDPCWSGRTFLRQQAAALRLALEGQRANVPGRELDGPLVPCVLGADFPQETLDHVGRLRVAGQVPSAGKVLVLHREPSVPPSMAEELAGDHVLAETVQGQEDILEADRVLAVPAAAVERIAGWLDAELPDRPVPMAEPPWSPTAVVHGSAGTSESFERLGDDDLFAVATTPGQAMDRPVLIFLNTALELHTGPGRLWVDLARRLAVHGYPSYRVDLRGIGESRARSEADRDTAYEGGLIEDVAKLVEAVSPGGSQRTILLGLCSGGYAAMASAVAFGVGGVVAVNPALEIKPHELAKLDTDLLETTPLPLQLRPRWSDALLNIPRLKRLAHGVPGWSWRVLDASRLMRSPLHALRPAVAGADDMLVIVSRDEGEPLLTRGRWIVDRLTATGRFQMLLRPIDHSLLAASAQRLVAEEIVAHLSGSSTPGPVVGRRRRRATSRPMGSGHRSERARRSRPPLPGGGTP